MKIRMKIKRKQQQNVIKKWQTRKDRNESICKLITIVKLIKTAIGKHALLYKNTFKKKLAYLLERSERGEDIVHIF